MSSTASPATNPAVRAEPGGHERGDHRPLSRPGRGPRRARPVHDEGRSPAAQLHQDPQGRRARWRPSPGSSRSTPSPTAVRCSRGSSPGPLSTTRCAHGVDLHPLDPQQRREAHHLGPGRRRGRDPVPRAGHGLRQRVGIHQPRRGAVGREPGHLLHPLAPVQEERPGHHRVQEQPRGAPLRLLLPLRHRRRAPGAGPPVGAGPAPESTS